MTIKEKGDHMIDETQLDKGEAIIFIELLMCERERHENESIFANMRLHHIPIHGTLKSHFWKSCVIRHEEDIIMIDKTITYLEQKFNLEE